MSTSNAQHARLGPSDSARWSRCPGAINATAGMPGSTSPAAEEGTAAHELLERSLLDNRTPSSYIGTVFNGYTMDADFVSHIAPVHQFVLNRAGTHGKLIPERRVNPGLWMNRDDCWGTGDITIINSNTVEIWDLKYGRGITVEPEDNTQLILYLIGVLADMTEEERKNITHGTIGIMQPRKWHDKGSFRSVTLPIPVIYEWFFKLAEAADATDAPDAPRIPGEKQCQWCKAKRNCRAHSDMIIDSMRLPDITDSAALEAHAIREPSELTGHELATIMENAPTLRGWLSAIETYCQDMLLEGTAPAEVMTGFKVVEGRSNRKFAEEDAAVLIKKLVNKGLKKAEILKPDSVKTATQIRAVAVAHNFSERKLKLLDEMIIKPKGKLSVVPRSASGKEVVTNPQEVFKDFIEP